MDFTYYKMKKKVFREYWTGCIMDLLPQRWILTPLLKPREFVHGFFGGGGDCERLLFGTAETVDKLINNSIGE